MKRCVSVAQTPPPIARQAAPTRPPPPATTHTETPLGSKESPAARDTQSSLIFVIERRRLYRRRCRRHRHHRRLLSAPRERQIITSYIHTNSCVSFPRGALLPTLNDVIHREQTRSSAIAEGPRDASCQLKSCQLPRNSAETTCTTSAEQIEVMKLED